MGRWDSKVLHEQILYPTVRVRVKNAGGSGTVLFSGKNKDGEYETYILTNYHVIESAIEVKKQWDSMFGREIKKEFKSTVQVDFFKYKYDSIGVGAQTIDADIVAYDAPQDLALLKLRAIDRVEHVANIFPPDKVKEEIRIFDEVIACGAALGAPPLPTRGFLSNLNIEIDNYIYWLSTALTIYGNCLPGDTLVSMSDNTVKPIKDVRPGEYVWTVGYTGLHKRKVLDVVKSGVKKIYKVTTRTRSIEASGNHPFLTLEATRSWTGKVYFTPVWKELKDLKEGDVIAVLDELPNRGQSKFNIAELFKKHGVTYKNGTNVDFMRLLGFLVGDGYVRVEPGERYEVSLSITEDSPVRAKYVSLMRNVLGAKVRGYENQVTIYGKNYASLFIDAGVYELDAEEFSFRTKTVPDWVFTAPREMQLAFIEGILDSDGWSLRYSTTEGEKVNWNFGFANKELTEKLRMLLIHMGYSVSNIQYKEPSEDVVICGKSTRSSGYWYFQAYPEYGKSRSTPLHGTVIDQPRGIHWEKIRSIDYVGEKETYDLKIDRCHNFFANGVLVHNSGGALYRWSEERERWELVGVPSRIQVIFQGFSSQAITHMGYCIPILSEKGGIIRFLEDWCYQFIYDPNYTIEQCAKLREEKRKKAEEEMKRIYGVVEEEE